MPMGPGEFSRARTGLKVNFPLRGSVAPTAGVRSSRSSRLHGGVDDTPSLGSGTGPHRSSRALAKRRVVLVDDRALAGCNEWVAGDQLGVRAR